MAQPLILVTNDDGIESPGLWAAVAALLPLGELLVVAPDCQWSGAGRSMPHHVTGRLMVADREVDGIPVVAYAVDASPALAVAHALLELAPRRPALVVSGINAGANLSTEITVSGTVGAALEAGAFGIPALAVSLEMDQEQHLKPHPEADYTAASAYVQRFAAALLQSPGLPYGVEALNINLPATATPATPWQFTRLSRRRYFVPLAPERERGQGRPGYRLIADPERYEPESDLWAVLVEKVVSVTPLSLDLTAAWSADLETCLTATPSDQAADMAAAFPDHLRPSALDREPLPTQDCRQWQLQKIL